MQRLRRGWVGMLDDCQTMEKKNEGCCSWTPASVNRSEVERNQVRRVLWIHGPPGCGKTIMAAQLVEPTSLPCTFAITHISKEVSRLSFSNRSRINLPSECHHIANGWANIWSWRIRLTQQRSLINCCQRLSPPSQSQLMVVSLLLVLTIGRFVCGIHWVVNVKLHLLDARVM